MRSQGKIPKVHPEDRVLEMALQKAHKELTEEHNKALKLIEDMRVKLEDKKIELAKWQVVKEDRKILLEKHKHKRILKATCTQDYIPYKEE